MKLAPTLEPGKTLLPLVIGCCLIMGLPASLLGAQPNVQEMAQLNPHMGKPLSIDELAVQAAGIRKIVGRHLDLYTDIPTQGAIDELTQLFDAAVPQWCQLLEVKELRTKPWRLSAFLIRDRSRFQTAGLMPADLPDFPTGFNRGYHFWVYEQPGPYYTRHLILHEGTHAFMQWFLGGSGPAWYSEGMAEKLALHRWQDGQLELNARLTSAAECEYWGRPKYIQDALLRQPAPRLDHVFDFSSISFQDVGSYAWSWAACEFLSRHPQSAEAFQRLTQHANRLDATFSLKFKSWFSRTEWENLEADWKRFVQELSYGITADRTALIPATVLSTSSGLAIQLRVDHSWQSTGLQVDQGEVIRLDVAGEFTVMQVDPTRPGNQQVSRISERPLSKGGQQQPDRELPFDASGPSFQPIKIPCSAGGITLRYYGGKRLGQLMAAVIQDDQSLSPPIPVGNLGEFTSNARGILAFRVNESPAHLFDNEGELRLTLFNQR